jgi:hypothetical protein
VDRKKTDDDALERKVEKMLGLGSNGKRPSRRSRTIAGVDYGVEPPTMSIFNVSPDGTISEVGRAGWRCPVCGRGLAPSTPVCGCVDSKELDAAVSDSKNCESCAPDFDEAFQRLADRYPASDTDVEVCERIEGDLDEIPRLVNLAAELDKKGGELVSENNRLQDRVDELLEGSMKLGSFAPLLSKTKQLAKLLGFEKAPNVEQIADVVDQAKIQIGIQRDELRSLRKRISELQSERKESSDPFKQRHGVAEV